MTKSDIDWNSTTFAYEMEVKNGLVNLHFSHFGWLKRNSEFRKTSFCWAISLKGLKDYLEKGIILPFEKRS